MSNIDIERKGGDVSLIPFEIIMRDEITKNLNEDRVNTIANPAPH